MLRFTTVDLRASGQAVRHAIQAHHSIKATVALECWGKALGGTWSSLMAQANQNGHIGVSLTPSVSRLKEALAHRRKDISELAAIDVLTKGLAATSIEDIREVPVQAPRKIAMRKLVTIAMNVLEESQAFSWEYSEQQQIEEGHINFTYEGHDAQVSWRDISFGELTVDIGIARPGKKADLRRCYYSRNNWLGKCRFNIERQDGPFIQYLATNNMMLSNACKKLLSDVEIDPPEDRLYRFSERVWM